MADGPLRLDWKYRGIKDIPSQLIKIIDIALQETPSQNTRTINKLNRWKSDLEIVEQTLQQIQTKLTPNMRRVLGIESVDEDMLLVALFQPSTKNLFMEMDIHFRETGISDDVLESLKTMMSLGEVAKVLALIGDAVISIAVLHQLWEKSEDVGDLTQSRAGIVSNENMAWLCDKWEIYDMRVHFDPPVSERSEMNHVKGTLIEAIYGMVYILGGLERVAGLVSHLIQ